MSGDGNNRTICEKLFGESKTEGNLKGKTLTVKVLYISSDDFSRTETVNGVEVTLGKGMHVYVKEAGDKEFTLISYAKSNPKAGDIKGSAKHALTIMMGGTFITKAGAICDATNFNNMGQNTTDGACQVGQNDELYQVITHDKGVVYLDNYAVWAGAVEMPSCTGYGAYAAK